MDTKQRIINQAIIEYNRKGIANVTSRDLAKKLGMSHGNLEYHFKNKESILITIYLQMRAEISESYMLGKLSEDPLIRFNKLLINIDDFQKRYKFFNVDLVEISRRYKKVNALLKETFSLREEQLKKFFDLFVAYEYLKFPDLQSEERLIHTIYVFITFWTYQNEFLPFHNSSSSISLSSFIWDLILPRMTNKGIEVYKEILNQ